MSTKLPTSKTDFKQLASMDKSTKKIESPFAKYNSIGQLTCIICNQVVKSELMWNAHLNSKTHIENKNNLKSKLTKEPPTTATTTTTTTTSSKTEKINSKTETFKRPLSPGQTTKTLEEKTETEDDSSLNKKQKLEKLIDKMDVVEINESTIIRTLKTEVEKLKESEPEETKSTLEIIPSSSLPEGFLMILN